MRVGGSKNSLRGFSLEGYRFYGFVIGQLSGCAGEHPVIGYLGGLHAVLIGRARTSRMV